MDWFGLMRVLNADAGRHRTEIEIALPRRAEVVSSSRSLITYDRYGVGNIVVRWSRKRAQGNRDLCGVVIRIGVGLSGHRSKRGMTSVGIGSFAEIRDNQKRCVCSWGKIDRGTNHSGNVRRTGADAAPIVRHTAAGIDLIAQELRNALDASAQLGTRGNEPSSN